MGKVAPAEGFAWSLLAGSRLEWLFMDGEWLVHEVHSGLTAQVSALEAALLHLLSRGDVLSMHRIRGGLQDLVPGEFLACQDHQLAQALALLVRLELVGVHLSTDT